MNPLSFSSSPSLLSSSTALTAALATAEAPLGRGPQAAREFEAHLLASLLDSLEKTFSTVPGQSAMPGADDYNYLGTQALASALTSSGGFGIAAMIAPHLGEHERYQVKVTGSRATPHENINVFATPADTTG